MASADEKKETRLTVRVPADEYKALKIKCAENDATITDVVRKSIREYINDDNKTNH